MRGCDVDLTLTWRSGVCSYTFFLDNLKFQQYTIGWRHVDVDAKQNLIISYLYYREMALTPYDHIH